MTHKNDRPLLNCSSALLIVILILSSICLVFAEDSFVNKVGIQLIKIEPGTFLMGSPPDEPGRKWDEKQHKVSITNGFYISTTEVTQEQWFTVMSYNPSTFKECGPRCPVESVSWHECQEFIKKLNAIEKTSAYRLPTEAEWEYACRAGSKTAFANGDMTASQCDIDKNLDKMGWYCGNTGQRKPVIFDNAPKPVGLKTPNKWNLYDMHGNVNEWCLDASKPRGILRTGVVNDTYNQKTISNPISLEGPNRIFRGGSWNTSTRYSRSANRGAFKPMVHRNYIGFRIVKEL